MGLHGYEGSLPRDIDLGGMDEFGNPMTCGGASTMGAKARALPRDQITLVKRTVVYELFEAEAIVSV